MIDFENRISGGPIGQSRLHGNMGFKNKESTYDSVGLVS